MVGVITPVYVVGGTKVAPGMPVDIEVGPIALEEVTDGNDTKYLSSVCMLTAKCVVKGVAKVSCNISVWTASEAVVCSTEA
jgi:hypothetical protein